MWLTFSWLAITSYLLGSIPSAVWIGKLFSGIDVREHGSKNAGATNVFRVLGKRAGIIVLCMDITKGVAAMLLPYATMLGNISRNDMNHLQMGLSLFVVAGHIFPVFASFRGGKGVATIFGVAIGIFHLAAFISALVFVVVLRLTHYVSLSSMSGGICFPLLTYFLLKMDSWPVIIFSWAVPVMFIYTHRKNIVRLVQGKENKIYLSQMRDE